MPETSETIATQYAAEFEREFDEWIRTKPQFTAKGAAFVEAFKEICCLWYLKGTKSAALKEVFAEYEKL